MIVVMCISAMLAIAALVIYIVQRHKFESCITNVEDAYMFNDWFCVDNTKIAEQRDQDQGYPTDLIVKETPLVDKIARNQQDDQYKDMIMRNPILEDCMKYDDYNDHIDYYKIICDGKTLNPLHNYMMYWKYKLFCPCLHRDPEKCGIPNSMKGPNGYVPNRK